MKTLHALLCACFIIPACADAGDWAQWCGSQGKNMVSSEKGLPETFTPGEKDLDKGIIKTETAANVKWGVKICNTIYSTPTVSNGKIFVGGMQDKQGILACLDEQTGKLLWQWSAPARNDPDVKGFEFDNFPKSLGVCSTACVDGNRVYFMSQRLEVICLDVNGNGTPLTTTAGTGSTLPNNSKEIWKFDVWKHGVRPCDACNGSPVIDGDFLYICTCNGVDRRADVSRHDELRKVPAPDAPSVIVLDKNTGRLLAEDDFKIGPRILHGSWSSVSIGTVAGRKLVVFGGGDGTCYAAEALSAAPEKPVKLKTVWSYDCTPAEYKTYSETNRIDHYCHMDRRRKDTTNKANDGTLAGPSEIIGTPVIFKDRVYVAMGRDPEHGRARGALHCIDAAKTGDITTAGKIWSYQGLDVTLSSAAVDNGLLYIADVCGKIHCLDVETGKPYWVHDTKSVIWSSTLVVDGRIYLGTPKGLIVMAAGKEEKELATIILGSPLYSSPVAANGTLFAASKGGWLWAARK